MSDRIDVWDPSPEGPLLIEQLRREGYEVRSIALAELVVTQAELVLLAGDGAGALPALKLLRDEGAHGDVPVIMLGVPEGMEHSGEGPGFGADAVCARPFVFEAIRSTIARLLGATDAPVPASRVSRPPERTLRLAGKPEPDSSQVFEVPVAESPWRPREPTLRLRDVSEDAPVSAVTRGRGATNARPPTSSGTGSRPGTGPISTTEAPEPEIPPEHRADLSPWLHELLKEADRRVFPDRSPLALHFPAADESVEELVPPELFEASAFRLDEPIVEDPIDAFTFVGGPALPPAVATGTPAPDLDARPSYVRGESTAPGTEFSGEEEQEGSGVHPANSVIPAMIANSWPIDEDEILGWPRPDGSFRDERGLGGAIAVLWRIASLRLDGIVELTCDDELAVRMTFLAGELRAFDGPIARTALAELRRRGRATESAADESGAHEALARKVEAGELGRYERDRLLREAREQLLHRVVRAKRSTFSLRRLEDTQPGRLLARARVLSRSLRAAIVEAARSAISVDEVIEAFGRAGVALSSERETALVPAELPIELVELLVRMDGRTISEILAAAPVEPGLAGVLFALIAVGALRQSARPSDAAPAPEAKEHVRAMLDTSVELARDGDYFSILGISRDADDARVEHAYRSRAGELAALPLPLLGLATHEDRRREALDAVDEAYRVLRDQKRRRSYAAALA